MTIGQRIAELRRQNNLSQEALGEALGVTRQSISKWESDGALPEIEKLVAMNRLFGVSVGALLGVEEETPAEGTEPGKTRQESELSEAQLRMVEEIAARYTDALREETLRQEQARREDAQKAAEKKKPGKKAILAGAFCAGLLLYGIISLFSRLERLDNNYTNLSHSINNVTDSVNRQISGIAYQVENILNEQNALTADFGTSVAEVNAKEMTVSFDVYAVPKTYEAGMTVEFLAESDSGETHSAEGIEGANARFSGRITCPLTGKFRHHGQRGLHARRRAGNAGAGFLRLYLPKRAARNFRDQFHAGQGCCAGRSVLPCARKCIRPFLGAGKAVELCAGGAARLRASA